MILTCFKYTHKEWGSQCLTLKPLFKEQKSGGENS
jgi:hypothetical protein